MVTMSTEFWRSVYGEEYLFRKELKVELQKKAQAIWDLLTESEKAGVRFGLFPAKKIASAAEQGFDQHSLARALMEVAAKNGGMKA